MTVVERLPNSSKWKCLCECGNYVEVTTNHLKQNHTRSCGCLQKDIMHDIHFKSHVGKKYGMLKVISLDTEKSTPKEKYYWCECECGNKKSINQTNFYREIISCGCFKKSKGEFKISQILKDYEIPFTTEQTFNSCINPKTNKHLRFDFYVNNSYLIEYNGIQHYDQNKGWDEALEDIQERDQVKIEWAKKHNIPLIIIPYTKYDDLTIDDLLVN